MAANSNLTLILGRLRIKDEIQYFEKKIVAWNGRIGLWILNGHGRFHLDQPWSIVQLRIVHSITADRFPMFYGYTRANAYFSIKGARWDARENSNFFNVFLKSVIPLSRIAPLSSTVTIRFIIFVTRCLVNYGNAWCTIPVFSSFLRIIIIYGYRKEMEFIYLSLAMW